MTGPNPTTAPAQDTATAMPLTIERTVMEAALHTGQATILSPLVTSLARYQDHWWIDTTDAWAQITDTTFTAQLEARHTRGIWH